MRPMRKRSTWLERAESLAGTLAATYVRMSTDHQRYSIAHQEVALAAYAAANNLNILRSYVDSGRSGLGIKNRPALNRLLDDVQRACCPFGVLLIYDISRWGRFQDTDEGAYYEQLCQRNNVRVVYCQEPFVNDGGSLGMLVKSIKRLMAAEYSPNSATKFGEPNGTLPPVGFIKADLQTLVSDARCLEAMAESRLYFSEASKSLCRGSASFWFRDRNASWP